MYKAIFDYHIYNTMLSSISNQIYQKNLILEPMCSLLKLILLQFKEKGTKISIVDNSIQFNEPSLTQGIIRSLYGDCREDLHNLYYPLIKCLEWYPRSEYELFYTECKKGLQIINEVYDNNTTIHHTISHYLEIVDGKNDRELSDTNPIIDNLKDIWSTDEIKAINELLTLILKDKNKDIYIKALTDIVSAKEKFINGYIEKVSTTY
jgi:hypothetical protein